MEGKKKKETTTTKYFKKNRLLCFVCEPKVDWKLIQSAPERGHPGDGRWGPQIRKNQTKMKKKREKLSLFQILPPSVVCVCMYINIHTQAHLCLYTKLTTKKRKMAALARKRKKHLRIEHFDGDFGGGLDGPQVGQQRVAAE